VRFLSEPVRDSGSSDDIDDESMDDQELNDWGDSDTSDSSDVYEVKPLSESGEEIGPKRIKKTARGVDVFLDNVLSRATGTAGRSREKMEEYAPRLKGGAKKVASTTKSKIELMDKIGDKYSRKIFTTSSLTSMMNFILDKPKSIIILIILLTGAISVWGILGIPPELDEEGSVKVKLQDNIRGDFEVYLPQEHETKIILDEIQEDWSTDIIVVVVETTNVLPFEDPEQDNTNITDLEVLKDMSYFEETFNYNRESDREKDGIIFLLSFSTIIKELNSTPTRMKNAIEKEFPFTEGFDFGILEGGYSIPDSQDTIDTLFDTIPPESKNKVIIDSNGDSIYDTGIILIGITQDVDQEKLVADMNEFVDNLENCEMTLTGPIPMTQAITRRTYEEFIKTLPAAILLVAGILMLFHRTWKIVIIAGVPVLCSLAITFGILGGLNMTLTPQVVLIAPILIALGVAYGLYIANRYSDESQIEDRNERIRVAVRTTGKAIFLSALTTAIGFASLMTVSMIPLQVLGFGLSMGIMICYAITMLTVPSLVKTLDYHKRGEIKVKEKIGNVPVVHRKKIIVGVMIFVVASIVVIPYVQANMDFIKMAPQDEPVIIKMREYSEKFGGGQQGMLVVRGSPARGDDVRDSMKDIDVLEYIENMENELNQVENTNVLSIVDFMKMIKPPGEIVEPLETFIESLLQEQRDIDLNQSFWSIITNQYLPPALRLSIINIFYDTLSMEMRGMFVNIDYSKTLLYIDMPTMDVVSTKEAVEEVNAIANKYNRKIDASHLTGFGAIIVAVNDMLVQSAIWSTVLALVFVLIVLAIIFKSFKFSAITLIPVCIVVILQPITLVGIRGLGGMISPGDPFFSGELNLFTAVIGSIIVGIGIDFGIHMTERIRERGMTLEGVRYGVSTSGMAFVEATVTMIGGLAAVFLVNIPAIQEFILLVMILLVYSVMGALFVLTAIYTLMIRYRQARGTQPGEEFTIIDKKSIISPEKLPVDAKINVSNIDSSENL
jgi:predicted RND superfamily exporter protein